MKEILGVPVFVPTLDELNDIAEYTMRHYSEFVKTGIVKLKAQGVNPPLEEILQSAIRVPNGQLKASTSQQTIIPDTIIEGDLGFRFESEALPYAAINPFKVFQTTAKTSDWEWYPKQKKFADKNLFAQASVVDELWETGTSFDAFGETAVDEVLDRFWRGIRDPTVVRIYDSGRGASLYNQRQSSSSAPPIPNLAKLGDQLSLLAAHKDTNGYHPFQIFGVNTPMMYLARANTVFGIHKEDLDLCSLNKQELGAPKVWYSVGESDVLAFEAALAEAFPAEYAECNLFWRHKMHVLHPSYFLKRGIQIYRAIQYPGEIVLTMPTAYHWGINTGFALNEAVNFAVPQWERHGHRADICDCNPSHHDCWSALAMAFKSVAGIHLPLALSKSRSDSVSGCM